MHTEGAVGGALFDLVQEMDRAALFAHRQVVTGEVVELAVTPGPTTGTLVHQLTGDLDADTYHVEVEETDGGVVTTAPGVGYYTLVIEPDLG